MSEQRNETALPLRQPRAYRIRVCGECGAALSWYPDDGEGMAPRARCADGHLVVDWHTAPIQPKTIDVIGVA